MTELPEDTPLAVVETLIAEKQVRRARQVLVVETLAQSGQDASDARQTLKGIEDTLTALFSRRASLKTMQASHERQHGAECERLRCARPPHRNR